MKINKRNLNLKVTALVTYLIMVAVNALANILPINGVTSAEVSDSYANLFAPAGVTFTIWGLIYFLLFLYTIYQFGILQGEESTYREDIFRKIGLPFIVSSLLNTFWIFAWHYRFIEISLVIIIGVLVSLILINKITREMKLSLKDYFFIRLPFSIYFGWVTVATIANVTTMLVKIGFSGFGISEAVWTVVILIVGLIIASLTVIRNIDLAYGLTIIWAYAGIYIKHVSNDGWDANYTTVIFAAVASIVILVMVLIYTLLNRRKIDRRLRDV